MRDRWLAFAVVASCGLYVGACNPERPSPGRSVDDRTAAAPAAPVARIETAAAWLDLVAQRPNAVTLRQGRVVVDLGRENARKHLAVGHQGAWELGAAVDDRRAGIIRGKTAAVDLPVDGPLTPGLHPDQDEHAGLALAVRLRALVPKQAMTLLVDEKPLANLRVDTNWQTRTFSLPEITPGEHRIRLHFSKTTQRDGQAVAAAVQWFELGPHAEIKAMVAQSPAPAAPYEVVSKPSKPAQLEVAAGTGLAYYFRPAARARLRVRVSGHGSVRVTVSDDDAHRAGRTPTVLLDEPLRGTGRDHALDLGAYAGVPIRLALEVGGSAPDAGATIRTLQVEVERSVPVDRRPRKPRDVFVLAVEGARADALLDPGLRPQLPNVAAFMQQALVFERAYTVGPVAVQAHAGWLSSVPPPEHLTVSGTYVADGQALLPETLGRAGYFGALVSANSDVTAVRGLHQGFATAQILGGDGDDRDAKAVADQALAAIETRRGRWFAYAVVNDPQAPFDPPRELLREVVPPAGAPLPHLTHVWVGRVRMGKSEPGPREVEYVRRLYRGELQVVDEALGAVLEGLRRDGRLDESVVVLVGLHGEEFLEHAGAGHGRTLFEESIRVPLAIRAPQVVAAGRVGVPVDLLDLAPTLADLLAVQPAQGWQGESLVPIIDDPQPPPRLVVAHLGDGSRAAIVGRTKFILGPGRNEAMFDLVSDPAEADDLRPAGGVELRIVRSALTWQVRYQSKWKRARWGTGADLRAPFALDLGM